MPEHGRRRVAPGDIDAGDLGERAEELARRRVDGEAGEAFAGAGGAFLQVDQVRVSQRRAVGATHHVVDVGGGADAGQVHGEAGAGQALRLGELEQLLADLLH